MSKPVILTEKQWAKLHYQLSKDYHSSVLLIRTKMKHVLGFTVRRHTFWSRDADEINKGLHPVPIQQIHLDFYNEPKRTMFLLKYSEFLEKPVLDK